MFQVLIAEDEAVIRQGLIQSIEWGKLGLELAGEAENGEQALAIMQKIPVDIVLTDMKMPICDGKTMLQAIEKNGYDCEVVVLSEYTDFAYMQQAIHAHVFDYLLKPVDIQELNSLFSRLVQKLHQKKGSRDTPMDAISELFFSVLSSPSSSELVISRFLDPQNDSGFMVGQLFLYGDYDPFDFKKSYNTEEYKIRIVSVSNAVYDILLLSDKAPSNIEYCLQREIKKIHKLSGSSQFRAGLSKYYTSLSFLSEAIKEASEARSFDCKEKEILNYDSVESFIPIRYPSPINDKQISTLLSSGKDVRAEISRLFLSSLNENVFLNMPAARRMLIEFSLSLERCCQETGHCINISQLIGESYLDLINQVEWREELIQTFNLILTRTCAALSEMETGTTETVLRRVLASVKIQYMEDLSLINFAQEYHINYIYLSKKFKEMTGETFTNYLMQVRMNKARELIEHDGLTEKQTASLVGYSNPYYFISSYRKYFGTENTLDE